jgi:transposase
MNKFKHFLGIDVSKDYFDASIIMNGIKEDPIHNQFENSYKGMISFRKWSKEMGATKENTLVCFEHTGVYGKLITKYLLAFGFSFWIEMPIKIIRSIGLQRGKNDKIDSARIAFYALKNQENAVIYCAPSKTVECIRTLLSLRDKLIKSKTSLKNTSNELKTFDSKLAKITEKHQKNALKGIEYDLKNIEIELNNLINKDENIERTYKLASSVVGIGKVTALYLICFTNEFTMYSTPRELACYVGIAPFGHRSGKTIRGKTKVHPMANKKLKKELCLCAMSAIQWDPEIKEYFARKVASGKQKMLVLNNVKNKLIHRVCACVRENKLFKVKEMIEVA